MNAPLAERMRPKSLTEYVGQTHIVGPKGALRPALEAGRLPSLLFWGPPGVGKTSLVENLAKISGRMLTRVNLSEQTDMMDLLGSEYPTVSDPLNEADEI